VVTIEQYGYSAAWLQMGPASGPVANGWWDCFSYFMGVWILMMYTWDYARFGRKEDATYHAASTSACPLHRHLFDQWPGRDFPGRDHSCPRRPERVSVVMAIVELMGIWGLIFVWISQTRINSANFYLAATNMQAFFGGIGLAKVPYIAWAIAVGVLVYT
jgi:hypothetical protein